jgi:hypothetical protein
MRWRILINEAAGFVGFLLVVQSDASGTGEFAPRTCNYLYVFKTRENPEASPLIAIEGRM